MSFYEKFVWQYSDFDQIRTLKMFFRLNFIQKKCDFFKYFTV